jgi:hypothetical protein
LLFDSSVLCFRYLLVILIANMGIYIVFYMGMKCYLRYVAGCGSQ